MSTLHPDNPLFRFLDRQGVVILDGGLATTLEARGHVLDDRLWSAGLLLDAPEAIADVHTEFLAAGADCITAATYQASLPGFAEKGLDAEQGAGLFRAAVDLAVDARDAFWRDKTNRKGRLRPLVAASVGPYGATLADGSEYTGDYDLDPAGLSDFHRDRLAILAESRADLLACETLPSLSEAEVLLDLLAALSECKAWFSFSCHDGEHLCDGRRLYAAVRACDRVEGVVAVGVNCTAPGHVASLITEARRGTDKPILVYPNSGEIWHARGRDWQDGPASVDWEAAAVEWLRLGAAGVGGCCRVDPARITRLREGLLP